MMIRFAIVLGVAASSLLVLAPADAAEWGTLKGKFVLQGKAPEIKPLNVTKDEFCIKTKPENKELILGKDNALVNVVIYLKPPRGKTVDVHPDYAASFDEPVVLDNKGCEFVPRNTLLRTGQEFIIKNSDPTGHNTNATLRKNGSFNVLIAANEERSINLSKEETIPMPVQCNIHPFMRGNIVVKSDPYMAVSDDDGAFEIKNIPAGAHDFVFWHEMRGYLKDVKHKAGKADRRGTSELEIPAGGELDLGTIEVPASLLK